MRWVRLDLPMEVCDAEWQWDRRKLTFYYVADSRVDFRELVRELFRLYKTRASLSLCSRCLSKKLILLCIRRYLDVRWSSSIRCDCS